MTEETIFANALSKADLDQRKAYLDDACAGNPSLRHEIEALLQAHEKADGFLARPAAEQLAAGRAQTDAAATEALERNAGGDEIREENALDFLQPSTEPGALGRLGHYEVLEVLGKGGFGIVLKAFDELLHRVVAIKVMSTQLAATSPARKRFLREARASAKVRHDNVVAIYAVEEQPIPYLVMEYIAGETLQQRLDRAGPFDTPEVLRLGQQIASGLAAAHAMGLIHRDIKPSNILLENGVEQRVKLTDFGLARAADDASLTQSGVIAGTPMYMAPEQAEGAVIDQRADLFSLGSVLYVMCSGRPPFRASTTMAVLKRVTEDTPRPIREIIPEVPEWLVAIISKLHAKKPQERFQTAKEVAEVLGQHLADLQSGAPRQAGSVSDRRESAQAIARMANAITPVADAPGSPSRRTRGLVVASACALAVLSIAAAVYFWPPGLFQGIPSTMPVVDAGNKDGPAIDLIPLARPDPALGNWKREGDTLVCTPGDKFFQWLPIPVELPREYELEAVIERLAGDEFMSFHMAAFGSPFHFMWDGFADQGSWSALGLIDKKKDWENETAVHGRQTVIGKKYTFRCTVRASGIVVTLDDKVLVNYTGGFDRLDDDYQGVPGVKLHMVVLNTVGVRVHRLRLTQLAPENKSKAPSPAVTPFVVLAGKGQPERSFATLKDAVDKATSGDTIEIRGNGPFKPGPLSLDKALTLRAGAGYRPVLVHTTDGYLLNTTAPLALEGLEFRSFGNKQKPNEHQWALIMAYATSLRTTHCRIVADGGLPAIWSWNSPLLEVKHSEVFSSQGGIEIGATNRGRYVIQNCCMGPSLAVALFESDRPLPKPARDAEVELIGNTFVAKRKIWANRFFRDPLDTAKEDFRSVRFKAVGNVFQSRLRFGVVEDWDGDRPFRPDPFADWYRAHVAWEARDNLFAVHGDFLVFTEFDDGKRFELTWKTPKDWQAFWKVEKAPGIEGTPQFAGGDLLERMQKTEPLTAADFRLEKGSLGQGAGLDGKDLGADVDRVGPGEPYEKWKQTPEYKEWQKKTAEVLAGK